MLPVEKILVRNVMKSLFYLFVLLIVGMSCEHIFPGEGKFQTREFSYPEVKKLSVDDLFQVTIVPDTITMLFISGGENQLKTVTVFYDSVECKLSLSNSVQMRMLTGYSPIIVHLHTPSLEELAVTLAAGIQFVDTLYVSSQFRFRAVGDIANAHIVIKAQSILVENIDTNGKIILEGEATHLEIFNRGISIVDASKLPVETIICRQYSLGDCHILANNSLQWEIFRNGNIIQYKNIPNVMGRSYSKGRLIIVE